MIHLHYHGFFVLAVLVLDLLVWAWRRGRRAEADEVLRKA